MRSLTLNRLTKRDRSKYGLDKFEFYYEDLIEDTTVIGRMKFMDKVWKAFYKAKAAIWR